jgi:hypothetical protein
MQNLGAPTLVHRAASTVAEHTDDQSVPQCHHTTGAARLVLHSINFYAFFAALEIVLRSRGFLLSSSRHVVTQRSSLCEGQPAGALRIIWGCVFFP